jgi:anti-anti-sigma factor
MDFDVIDLGDATKVALRGRLDTVGVGQIETRFIASIVPAARHALIDLSDVAFVSSMGIRLLIMTGRSLQAKKARMIVFGAQPLVRDSLDSVSLGSIVPLASSEAEALDLLKS